MRAKDSATDATGIAVGSGTRGTLLAALGVAAFSLTFPGTAWALEGLGPWSLTTLRIVFAALVAGACLLALRVPLPERRHWPGLLVVAGGVVIGFPLLTALALRTSSTSHAAVVVGLLPLATAAFSAVRMGIRPSRTFWAAAVAGAVVVVTFALAQSGGAPTVGDLYLFAALLVCAAGYTEGGRLARDLPGWQVIGWALVVCLPPAVPGAALALAAEPARFTAHTVAGLVWVAVGSQFLGMVVWYRGMAAIGVARASQLQLAQPLLTLFWSVALLGEHLAPAAPLTAVAVLVCIAVTQRAPSRTAAREGARRDSRNRLTTTERRTLGSGAAPPNGRSPQMEAKKGDTLLVHGRTVGHHDRKAKIIEVLGDHGEPPYKVRFEDDGKECLMSPGPDSVIRHPGDPTPGT